LFHVDLSIFVGDLHGVRALVASGVDLGGCDYDGRTPLHLAASEGQLSIVKYLAVHGVDLEPVDRWGGTPLTDAQKGNHTAIVSFLTSALQQSSSGKLLPTSPIVKSLISSPMFAASNRRQSTLEPYSPSFSLGNTPNGHVNGTPIKS
jgi:ankyrin repeat protein